MELKRLFTDERAVAPVVAVILLVAIAVILAAVIGTFALGLGEEVQNTAPQASVLFDYREGEAGTDCLGKSSDNELAITHSGGDKVDTSRVGLEISDGATRDDWTNCGASNTVVTSGDTANPEVLASDTIRVVWTGPDGDNTATLGKWTGPAA